MEGQEKSSVQDARQFDIKYRIEFITGILTSMGRSKNLPEGPKINLGCGQIKIPDFVNVDKNPKVNPDVLELLDMPVWSFPSDHFTFAIISHLIEHIKFLPDFMEELYRIMAPDSLVFISCPYAWSNQAIEDPTHVRMINENSMAYFSRNPYLGKDNGYEFRCDFNVERVILIPSHEFMSASAQYRERFKLHQINFIKEINFMLQTIKPMREI